MQNFEINLFGLLSLIGLIQTVYAFVYLSFRAGDFKRAAFPLAFFLTLAGGFLMTFVAPYAPDLKFIPSANDFFWSSLNIISVLMLVQIASIERPPPVYYQTLLLMLFPIAFLSLYTSSLLPIVSIVLGGLSLLTLWAQRDLIGSLLSHKVSGRERYWLILSVITLNVILISLTYGKISGWVDADEFTMIRIVIGLGLVYLVSTTMFRLYPQAIHLVDRQILKLSRTDDHQPKFDQALIDRLKDIIDIQKLYQEPNFSRSELAKEMGISETVSSKLVSDVYGKSLPQLINERRIEEACDLLQQTKLNISSVAEQVGFNSIASFNRVFREVKGESPSDFRRKNQM